MDGRPTRAAGRSVRLAPDQQLILAWQRLAGNAAVQRLLVGRTVIQRAGPEPMRPRRAASPGEEYRTLPAAVQAVLDAGRYGQLVADKDDGPGVRVSLVGVHKLLSREGDVWKLISKVQWVGMGSMLVTVSPSAEAFKHRLQAQGFESKWLAASGKDLWGLRKTVEGVGLHIRGKGADEVEIHFDLHPPKWYALFGLWHVIMDKWARGLTVTPSTLKKALGLENEL